MTSPEGPAVEALRLTLESLALMEIDADRVCLVVNHVGGTGTAGAGGLGETDAAYDQGLPVTAAHPRLPRPGGRAVLVAPRDAGHPLAVAVRQVARAVRGRDDGPVDGPVGRLLRRRPR